MSDASLRLRPQRDGADCFCCGEVSRGKKSAINLATAVNIVILRRQLCQLLDESLEGWQDKIPRQWSPCQLFFYN